MWRRLLSTRATVTGFAGIPGLRQPGDWHALARDAVTKCEGLVGEVMRATPTVEVVQLLDDISDTLCRVLDAAEFCRNVHADEEWRRQAQQACVELSGYVQQLNTHYSLYTALMRALHQHEAADTAAGAARAAAADSGGMTAASLAGQRAAHPAAAAGEGGAGAAGCISAAAAARRGGRGSLVQPALVSLPQLAPPLPAAPAAGAGAGPSFAAGAGGGLDEESILVGRMLQRDFERYGVHLSGEQRDRMNHLMHSTQLLGMQFTQNVLDPRQLGSLHLPGELATVADQLPTELRRRFRSESQHHGVSPRSPPGLSCPADTHSLQSVLRQSRHEGLRRLAFERLHRTPIANLDVLDSLVEARHQMARLMGYNSYSSYQLDSFTLASHPAAVAAFLQRLEWELAPMWEQEGEEMRQLKEQLHSGGDTVLRSTEVHSGLSTSLKAWDRSFLMAAAESQEERQALHTLPAYFELESVVQGLSQLLMRSMGVQLQEQPLDQGEGWAPGVRKLQAVHDTDGFLGTVYLDLYRRPNKFPSAAHFTLRCGRALPDGSYQTPVVALVANMPQHAGLTLTSVEMLFHEFGHALNSLLSRTRYQHLSGTRGPLDLVEVPSHTLELFASDPRVLALFARHRETGEALPVELLHTAQRAQRRFNALEQQAQIKQSMIDQLLHGPLPPTGKGAEQKITELMQRQAVLAFPEGHSPHIRFTHLVGYGATYYSYLYAQCLSATIWRDHLADDPLSREAGELLRHRLFEPGGAREAHRMVSDLLSPTHGTATTACSGHSMQSSSGVSGERHRSGGGLCRAEGGWYPDPTAMLEHHNLLPSL